MQSNDNASSHVPQVEFHGTGIRVNGAEVSGDVLLAWITYAADRGYVLKFDHAMTQAFERTDGPQAIGMFDALTNLIQIAGGAA